MADSILDRLDRNPGGAREYVATLLVAGDATREQVAEALARKYSIAKPTGRTITKWKNHDPELRELIQKMEAVKRDAKPGDDADLLRPQVTTGRATLWLFDLADRFPAFANLLRREGGRREAGGGGDDGLGYDPYADPVVSDEDGEGEQDDNVTAVLLADHETDAEFEADCVRRLGADYNPHAPEPGAGALRGYEPLATD